MYFLEEQLFWVEECANWFVEVLSQPKGEVFELTTNRVEIIQICTLPEFISQNHSDNLWRSWKVFRDCELEQEIGPLPIVIDIDDESDGTSNLQNAYKLTRICLEEILRGNNSISLDNLRVVFSGRKGFHIELKPPHPLNAQVLRRELISSCRQRNVSPRFGNVFFENTVIDIFHDYIRLTDSINSWINNNNELISRNVFQMSVTEFEHLKVEGILEKAEAG
jgi:hypothetical protein